MRFLSIAALSGLLSISVYAHVIENRDFRIPNLQKRYSCPAGSRPGGNNACLACPAGTFNSAAGSTSCQSCPADTYSTAGATRCTSCRNGTTSSAGSSQCTNRCGSGQYWSGSQCFDCGAGRYNSAPDLCATCPANTYSALGASSCTLCPSGTSSTAGSSKCTCAAGQYWNVSQCSQCPANTYSAGGLANCSNCPGGTTASPGSSQCTNRCGSGQYWNGAGCYDCGPGRYNSTPQICSTCPANTYSVTGDSSCTSCPSGTSSTAGSSKCNCVAGQYWSGSQCSTCPANSYSAAGASSCTPCPSGSTSSPGSSACGPQPSKRAQPVLKVGFCAAGFQSCPVLSGMGGTECIDPMSTLDSCGGCVGTDGEVGPGFTGRDCSAIPHVDKVRCNLGRCEVKSCRHGYEPSGDSCAKKPGHDDKNSTSHTRAAHGRFIRHSSL